MRNAFVLGCRGSTALAVTIGLLPAHSSKAGPEPYIALLSKSDHYNSGGERLSSVADILRQDRANFHNGDGDKSDQDDPYFGSKADRSKFDTYKIVLVGISKDSILKGTPLVEVAVEGKTTTVREASR